MTCLRKIIYIYIIYAMCIFYFLFMCYIIMHIPLCNLYCKYALPCKVFLLSYQYLFIVKVFNPLSSAWIFSSLWFLSYWRNICQSKRHEDIKNVIFKVTIYNSICHVLKCLTMFTGTGCPTMTQIQSKPPRVETTFLGTQPENCLQCLTLLDCFLSNFPFFSTVSAWNRYDNGSWDTCDIID